MAEASLEVGGQEVDIEVSAHVQGNSRGPFDGEGSSAVHGGDRENTEEHDEAEDGFGEIDRPTDALEGLEAADHSITEATADLREAAEDAAEALEHAAAFLEAEERREDEEERREDAQEEAFEAAMAELHGDEGGAATEDVAREEGESFGGVADQSEDSLALKCAEKLRSAVDSMLMECGSDIESLPEGRLRSALLDWQHKLEAHANDLDSILETEALNLEDDPTEQVDEQMEEQADEEALDPHNALCDPHHLEKLRACRQNIRYLFGGKTNQDLLATPPETPIAERLLQQTRDFVPATVPKLPLAPHPSHGARPRSGGTDLSSAASNASSNPWDSEKLRAEDEEARRWRKAERRERRRERKERKERELRELPKKADVVQPKVWNWADEVVKACMDPQNQWEFPGRQEIDSARGAAAARPWEQPRQGPPRGTEVASRARERAHEVLKAEQRDQRGVFAVEPPLRGLYR